MDNQPSLCFFIACKVVKNYISYLPKYINNIKTFYPDALILLIDNNSVDGPEFYKQFQNIKNVICLENTSESKFEQGAYNFGTKYIINNNLKYDYYICIQDTFIMVNKYDFNILKTHNTKACSIHLFSIFHDTNHANFGDYILKKVGLFEVGEEYYGCYGISYICNYDCLIQIYNMTQNCIIIYKYANCNGFTRTYIENNKINYDKVYCSSDDFEASLGKILYVLNNKRYDSIEGFITDMKYSTYNINPLSDEAKKLEHCFIKAYQGKV